MTCNFFFRGTYINNISRFSQHRCIGTLFVSDVGRRFKENMRAGLSGDSFQLLAAQTRAGTVRAPPPVNFLHRVIRWKLDSLYLSAGGNYRR